MLAGVLVDVSGSMADVLQPDVGPGDQSITRTQSIFSTTMSIIQREGGFRENEEIFVLAFGLQDVNTCDLLSLLHDVRRLDRQYETIGHELLTRLLAQNGAPYTGEFIRKYLSQQAAGALYETFSEDQASLINIVTKLPVVCKNRAASITYSNGKAAASTTTGQAVYAAGKISYSVGEAISSIIINWLSNTSHLDRTGRDASNDTTQDFNQDIYKDVNDEDLSGNYEEQMAKKYIKEAFELSTVRKLKTMLRPRQRSLDDVVSLLRDITQSSDSSSSEQRTLSAAQLSQLAGIVKPYIYGDTPMCEALEYALQTFQSSSHTVNVLFVLSDGESKDGDPVQLAKRLRECGVIVFACLLTSKNIRRPRRLFDTSDPHWPKAQRDMFEMSSIVPNTCPAMAILLKKHWELPVSGESRLFLQANHPDVIDEFSSLVREMGESNDALLDILGSLSMDMYINISNAVEDAKQQIGKTCWANAVATVFHLAMRRIEGREGGVPDLSDILNELIEAHKAQINKTEEVLHRWAPFYRLRYKKVEELEAREAINARRSLVATFRLRDEEWTAFQEFYAKKPRDILQAQDLQTHGSSTETFGHAVVLIRCDATSLTFMNSWGTKFANGGFFKVRNQSVLNLSFYDVYWELEDLLASEIAAFQSKSRDLGQELLQTLPSTLQNLPYECPECLQLSPAAEFTGHLLKATCPKCHQSFKPAVLGLMRSLYTR